MMQVKKDKLKEAFEKLLAYDEGLPEQKVHDLPDC